MCLRQHFAGEALGCLYRPQDTSIDGCQHTLSTPIRSLRHVDLFEGVDHWQNWNHGVIARLDCVNHSQVLVNWSECPSRIVNKNRRSRIG
jgi:hypothetical protein